MSQLGMGVMIRMLGGGSEHSPSEYQGKKVTGANFSDERIILEFEDGKKIKVFDNGQSCCEHRYMTCDDDPDDIVGGDLVSIEVKDGPYVDEGDYGDVHEQQFLEITTTKGFINIANHNEHNGYYGGFSLEIEEVK